jgi:hypothetical protein
MGEPNETLHELHDYARRGDIEGVQRLLNQGEDINKSFLSF